MPNACWNNTLGILGFTIHDNFDESYRLTMIWHHDQMTIIELMNVCCNSQCLDILTCSSTTFSFSASTSCKLLFPYLKHWTWFTRSKLLQTRVACNMTHRQCIINLWVRPFNWISNSTKRPWSSCLIFWNIYLTNSYIRNAIYNFSSLFPTMF